MAYDSDSHSIQSGLISTDEFNSDVEHTYMTNVEEPLVINKALMLAVQHDLNLSNDLYSYTSSDLHSYSVDSEEDAKTAIDIGLTMDTSVYSFPELNPKRPLVFVASQYGLESLHDYRMYISSQLDDADHVDVDQVPLMVSGSIDNEMKISEYYIDSMKRAESFEHAKEARDDDSAFQIEVNE
ncbi:unnamed protein product [Thelazia callipaeda]|uniref:YflT domain-containing protein n=1 Tax=Thelazia callipaeda TaxID=103827 RepID=A0A0N5D7N6_THECL|nr:unnamed protein product [Thelazia callipaeda]